MRVAGVGSVGEQVLDLHLDLVERDLRQLEQHQPRRGLPQDLAHQLRADRAAGAGHHHRFAADAARQQVRARRHRIAAEQVLDVDRAQVADGGAAGGEILDRRQRLDADGKLLQPLQDGWRSRRCDSGSARITSLHVLALDQAGELVGPVDLHAAGVLAPQRGGVVEKADDAGLAGAVQRVEQLHAGLGRRRR